VNNPATEIREASDLTAKDPWKNFGLPFVGAVVDVDAGGAVGLPGPQITLPSSNPDKAQIIEIISP
jgi:hypothetical protein